MTGRELRGGDGGHANQAAIPRVRTYTCPDCGAAGTEPTHSRFCGHQLVARLRASEPLAEARACLAAMDSLGGESPETLLLRARLLRGHLAAVLAEIDREATG